MRLPAKTFAAKVGALSGLASRAGFFEASSVTRQFDVTFQFDKPDPRMKAGASARVAIDGKELRDALTVPRQAVFQKNGKTHVFVKVGERFEQREVKIIQRTESRVALEGLTEGSRDRAGRSDRHAPAGRPARRRCHRRSAAMSACPTAVGTAVTTASVAPARIARPRTSCPNCASASTTCAPTSCARC